MVPTACVANTRFAGDITAVFAPVMPVPDNVRVVRTARRGVNDSYGPGSYAKVP